MADWQGQLITSESVKGVIREDVVSDNGNYLNYVAGTSDTEIVSVTKLANWDGSIDTDHTSNLVYCRDGEIAVKGDIPQNVMTTDTVQTVTSKKVFDAGAEFSPDANDGDCAYFGNSGDGDGGSINVGPHMNQLAGLSEAADLWIYSRNSLRLAGTATHVTYTCVGTDESTFQNSTLAFVDDIPTNVSQFTNDAGYLTSVPLASASVNGLMSSSNFTKLNGLPSNPVVSINGNTPTDGDLTLSLSDFDNDVGFITASVGNLTNYYTKSSTYTRSEVDNLLSAIPKFAIQPVDVLPSSGSPSTIYLLRDSSGTNNLYTEYIYVDGKWELIGTATVDLSNYYTIGEIDSKLGGYVPATRTVNGMALSANITLDKSDIGLGNVPNVNCQDAENITSGTLSADRIPSLNASKITAGTLSSARLPIGGSAIGGVKSSTTGTVSGRDYSVQINADGTMKVNVPWTDTNTTYSVFKGATASTAGGAGLVPAPQAGNQARFLRGDGSWQAPPNTTYTAGVGLSLSGSNAFSSKLFNDGTKAAGKFYTGSTAPTSSTRINYDGYLYSTRVYNSVFNDYAEYRLCDRDVAPGFIVVEDENHCDYVKLCTTDKPTANIFVVSDTFGQCMAIEYPERVLGRVSSIPSYDVWGADNVQVNNRVWVNLK